MSLWTRSASSKWTEDVAMAVKVDSEAISQPHLPPPVTQSKNPQPSFFRSLRCTLCSKGTKIIRIVKKTLTVPLPESLGDVQLQRVVDINGDAVELAPAVPVGPEPSEGGDEVDEIVVDRAWNDTSSKTSLKSKESDRESVAFSSRASSYNIEEAHAALKRYSSCFILIRRLYSWTKDFFNYRFPDQHKEEQYQKENWALSKHLSLWASLFFIGNWILGAALIPTPAVLADKIYYYGFAPCTAVPLVLLCAFDIPRDYSKSWQCLIFFSTWAWSYYQVLFGFLCGYSGLVDLFTCGTKDFSSTFYYTTALQTIALFGLNLNRFPALLGSIIFIVLSAVLIVPEKENWMRNVINFTLFQIFLLYLHYQREVAARHLFELRIELKEQFERTQKAQVNERKAADSKYRLTSYVFHDKLQELNSIYVVRVPLNTALLAVQNMSASGTISKSLELEFTALEGSLSMMSKVLNDVLDFNRMDSGKFESLSKPYAFHQVMRSMFLPLRLATDARRLELVTDLDMNIDEVARRAAYEALGEDREAIDKHMKEQPSGENHHGIVVGDQTRLRQIVTNLASNACKFTPAGGKLTIRTRLILPNVSSLVNGDGSGDEKSQEQKCRSEDPSLISNSLTLQNVEQHNSEQNPDSIVVRIEVTDTGSGIRPQDMFQSKLFSAFNQTEQGRQQGGKGTGLGLALVRLIVRLSGGRLGVRSKAGAGSTFWVELPLGVGVKAMLATEDNNVLSSPAGNVSSNTLRQFMKSKHHRNSTHSIVDAVDAATQRATQASPVSLRSKHALHGLMDQGGSVELNLANYDSHSPVPTRMIGDRSTGSDIPMSCLSREQSLRSDVSVAASRVLVDHESDSASISGLSSKPSTSKAARPTYVPLPSPKIFPFDSSSRSSSPTSSPGTSSVPGFMSPTQFPPSPLANRAFPPPSPSVPMFSQPLRVLVVDDDALTRTLMKRMLERMGCEVTTAENGDLALKILLSPDSNAESNQQSSGHSPSPPGDSQTQFNIVFLDNQMPVLSGLKAVSKLRELGRRDLVVGVTGNALISDQKEYLDAGVDHVLTKPVLERSLRSMLQVADDRRKITS